MELCILEAHSWEEGLILRHATRELKGGAKRSAILGKGDVSTLKIQKAANDISLVQCQVLCAALWIVKVVHASEKLA